MKHSRSLPTHLSSRFPRLPAACALGFGLGFCLVIPAQAATKADMEVIATITPVACTPTLSGNGVADYGSMPASILRPGSITPLPPKSLTLTVGCDAGVKLGLRVIDNRRDSIVAGIVASGSGDNTLNDNFNFGLGIAAGKKIGGYVITLEPNSYTGDYQQAQLLSSADGGVTWQKAGNGAVAKGRTFSWGARNSGDTSAFKNISGMVRVHPYINRPEDLSLSQEIQLDGAATLELTYL